MRGRLFLGEAPGDYDPAADIVAGPWCFLSNPTGFERWSRIDFLPDPGESSDERAKIIQRCTEFAEVLLVRLIPELNHINGTDHSLKFWRVMTMMWLLSLVQIMFFAQERAKALKQAYGHLLLNVELAPKNTEWCFPDSRAFNNKAAFDPDFFTWMLSRYIEESPPQNWKVSYSAISMEKALSPVPITGGGLFIRTARGVISPKAFARLWEMGWQWRLLLTPRCIGVYGVRGWRACALSVLLFLKKPLVEREASLPCNKNDNAVCSDLLDTLPEEDVLELVWRTIPASMKDLKSLSCPAWNRRCGKVLLVGPQVLTMDRIKHFIALGAEAGEVVIGSQHGAVYGDGKYVSINQIEYRLDGFITWGWKSHGDYRGHFIPLPSPWLGREKHQERTDNLLFVGVLVPLIKPRLDPTPGAGGTIRYVRMKRDFLEALVPGVRQKLIYRSQPAPFALDEIPYLQQYFPSLEVLNTSPETRLFSCRLLVIDNPSTVLHIALSANVPTVCYWERDAWPMTPDAETYYELLRNAGILFHDPASAAEQVNCMWPNIQGWWQSDKVQHARKTWCKQFALTDDNWFPVWAKTFWNLRKL